MTTCWLQWLLLIEKGSSLGFGKYQLVAHQNDKVEVLRTIVGEESEFKMHHRRLKRYRPADSLLLDQWKEQAAYNDGCLELEEIVKARWSIEEERLELPVRWRDLAKSTWESWEAVVDEDPHRAEQCLITIIRDWPSQAAWCKQISNQGPFGTPRTYYDTFGDASACMDWKAQIDDQVEQAANKGKRLPRALARLT